MKRGFLRWFKLLILVGTLFTIVPQVTAQNKVKKGGIYSPKPKKSHTIKQTHKTAKIKQKHNKDLGKKNRDKKRKFQQRTKKKKVVGP